MTSQQSSVLVIVVIVVIMVAIILVGKNRHRIKRVILNRLHINPKAGHRKPHETKQPATRSEPKVMSAEESKAELKRLQKLIKDRKKMAWDTDISHHLWGLYKGLLPHVGVHSSDSHSEDGEWYTLKILQVSTHNGLNVLEFELRDARYKFVDDEEKQNWRDKTKIFSLFLYDASDRCLIEIPMKSKLEGSGRSYSISSVGPNAMLPGRWISDFINVKLKHQRMRNQEIRAQKHQARLSEIEDLKGRFGILD